MRLCRFAKKTNATFLAPTFVGERALGPRDGFEVIQSDGVLLCRLRSVRADGSKVCSREILEKQRDHPFHRVSPHRTAVGANQASLDLVRDE